MSENFRGIGERFWRGGKSYCAVVVSALGLQQSFFQKLYEIQFVYRLRVLGSHSAARSALGLRPTASGAFIPETPARRGPRGDPSRPAVSARPPPGVRLLSLLRCSSALRDAAQPMVVLRKGPSPYAPPEKCLLFLFFGKFKLGPFSLGQG